MDGRWWLCAGVDEVVVVVVLSASVKPARIRRLVLVGILLLLYISSSDGAMCTSQTRTSMHLYSCVVDDI